MHSELCVFRLGPARFIDFRMREFLRQGWLAHLIKQNKTVIQWKITKTHKFDILSEFFIGKGNTETTSSCSGLELLNSQRMKAKWQKCPFSSAKKWHFERPNLRTDSKNLTKHPPK